MTIIATDGIHIAADGLSCAGHEIVSTKVKKIAVLNNVIYALAGTGVLFNPLINWHRAGADPAEVPKGVAADQDWALLVITEKWGKPYFQRYHSKAPYPDDETPLPIVDGVAGELAKGAMRRGATAEEAVRIACEGSVWCGGDIQVVDIAEALGLNTQLQAAE